MNPSAQLSSNVGFAVFSAKLGQKGKLMEKKRLQEIIEGIDELNSKIPNLVHRNMSPGGPRECLFSRSMSTSVCSSPISSINPFKPPRKTPYTVDPQNARKQAHIASEQKRRQSINEGFEELKKIIPSCQATSDSKAVILRKGTTRLVIHPSTHNIYI